MERVDWLDWPMMGTRSGNELKDEKSEDDRMHLSLEFG